MGMKVIGYWATTALLSFAVVSGGAAELARRPDNVQGLLHLGYPVYFATIIGFWKVLGGLTVLAVASWSLRPQRRVLGVLFPAKARAHAERLE